ncbi:MAG TPA: hypothetical protein VF472_03035 [Burkholderiaceae bacterium]
MTQQQTIYLILIPFIVWRLYSRTRKLIARQEARPGRLWFSVTLFPLLTLLMAWGTQGDITALGSLAGGALCGASLAMLGLKLTQFDVEAGKLFYRPNMYIGMGLMMVFVTRIAYRFLAMSPAGMRQGAAGDAAMQRLTSSPLTLFVMGLVFCYYAPYSAGILLRRAQFGKEGGAGINLQQ